MSILAQQMLRRALDLFHKGRLEEADRVAEDLLTQGPQSAEALHIRGVVAGLQRRHVDAEKFLLEAASLAKSNHFIHFNLAKALSEQGKDRESIRWHKKALQLDSRSDKAWLNYGLSLKRLGDLKRAIGAFDRALAINPSLAEGYSNKGSCLRQAGALDQAISLHDCAVKLNPLLAEAWSSRGNTLRDLGRLEEALASYERSIEIEPNAEYVLGDLVHTQMRICDWTDFDGRCKALMNRLLTGDPAGSPFVILGLFDDPVLQRRCAELYSERVLKESGELGPIGKRSRRDRIRVGYFSMDFREHPVAHLIAELIETHDRDKFEIFGFSFGEGSGDSMRKRLEGAFDKFTDVSPLSELNIARLSRSLEIDIAIDIGGYTADSRPAIFSQRAAPIQMNYLGFPGTMGTVHFDYLIGDYLAVSAANLEHFSERVIFLPNSFQANPSQRPIGLRGSNRLAYGLPEVGFVFCCFNNIWKLTPEVFKLWIRILREAEDSVLWLSVDRDSARSRLRGACSDLGVDPRRLIFSPRVTRDIYFDQYRFADLFLDTLPYNAGTTASDALWMGVPLVTQVGQSFAGRMASSLLHSVGLPELITHNSEEYVSMAVELANNPQKVAKLKSRLVNGRTTCPLFNVADFTQHIESAYLSAYDRYLNKLPPDHIHSRIF